MKEVWYTLEGFSRFHFDDQGRPRLVAWNKVYQYCVAPPNATKYWNKDDALLANPDDGTNWRVVRHELTRIVEEYL